MHSGTATTAKMKLRAGRVTSWFGQCFQHIYKMFINKFTRHMHSLKLTACPGKWMVGILVSFWDGLFSGAVIVSGGVGNSCFISLQVLHNTHEAMVVVSVQKETTGWQAKTNLWLDVIELAPWKITRWWFHFSLNVHPYLGKWSNLTNIFLLETTN